MEPSRLLDILAHFIVFESREGRTIKKVCRYQQYRAASKMVQRVVEGRYKQGLIWHTQGSGKSLTMVFAALKLKFHRGIRSPRLHNPNILVVTDRRDLDRQIAKTFVACGLPNPQRAESIRQLQALLATQSFGRTILSTVQKFQQDDPALAAGSYHRRRDALSGLAVEGSENWIVMVDECHRSQEKEMGAFLRATLPDAVRFGFTGTPVKKGDLDTYRNFGLEDEPYLDRYSIDDAVRDGATVPIFYMGRKTEWWLHDKEIDAVFEQWFASEPEEVVDELKARGVTRGDLARFEPRIDLIAQDIWAHYRAHVQPDGFKAQVVAIDRRACVAYKRALRQAIAQSLVKTEGMSEDEARTRAEAMTAAVYTAGQHDAIQYPELAEHQLSEQQEKEAIADFVDPEHPLCFMIVCNKLLTGFDAPVEQAMYLDKPLTDHNLLQAIARTNRRYGTKRNGLIVDYIGISRTLNEALSAYRREDVEHAMRPEGELRDELRYAHRGVMGMLAGFERTDDVKADVVAVVEEHIRTEDRWYEFRALAKAFLDAYASVSPDPACLPYTDDVKFVGAIIPYGKQRFEQEEERDWRGYSEKIRVILREYLEVTGLTTTYKLRSLNDVGFWDDFDAGADDLETAAVRKMTEMKAITAERAAYNPAQYERFSDRVKEIIAQFDAGHLAAVEALKQLEDVAEGIKAEDEAYAETGLTPGAHAIWRILEQFEELETGERVAESGAEYEGGESEGPKLTRLQRLALEIDALYSSDELAPPHWQEKSALRRELRNRVRKVVFQLGGDAWRKIPPQVDEFAVRHYSKT